MRPIHAVIVHHSDSSEYTTVEQIRQWHTDPNKPGGPFSDIGYHWVVSRGANHLWGVHAGRPESKVGAHDYGANTGTIGICVCGRYTKTDIDPCALVHTARKVASICKQYGLSESDVYGHSEHAPGETDIDRTDCPGFDMNRLRRLVAVELHYLTEMVAS